MLVFPGGLKKVFPGGFKKKHGCGIPLNDSKDAFPSILKTYRVYKMKTQADFSTKCKNHVFFMKSKFIRYMFILEDPAS